MKVHKYKQCGTCNSGASPTCNMVESVLGVQKSQKQERWGMWRPSNLSFLGIHKARI